MRTGLRWRGSQPKLTSRSHRLQPVECSLPDARRVDLAVYDLLGRRVATIATGIRVAGTYKATWDGHDARGQSVGPGVYIVRLVGDAQHVTRRITRVR